MVVLGPRNEVELITAPAQRLLEPLHRDSRLRATTVPLPILPLLQLPAGNDSALSATVWR
jgi:hypothetical protein